MPSFVYPIDRMLGPHPQSSPISFFKRPLTWLLLFALAAAGLLGSAWLQLPVSNQELLANYAKAQDFWSGWAAVKGIPWWSPNFMQGTSLAFTWTQIFTHLLMGIGGWLGGLLVGPKIAALVAWFLSALTAYGFVARLTRSQGAAALAGFFYFFSASLIARIGWVEHFIVVLSMAFLPLAFWGIMEFVRRATLRTTAAAALGISLLALTYSKTAIMASPALLAFALFEYFKLPHFKRPAGKWVGLLALLLVGLTVLPVLPAMRESGFAAFFEFAPLQGWQAAFSTKTSLSWLDRNYLLTFGMAPGFAPTTANPGTYLGLGSFIIFAFFLSLLARGRFSGERITYCRLFITLALGLFWLSFGPSGVLRGQLTFLSMANNAPDFSIALSWLMLALPVWVIFALIPSELPGQKLIASALSAIFLLIPGFRILELLPFFDNIRAPFDFIQITGTFCLAVAAGLCLRELLRLIPKLQWQCAIIGFAVILQILDVWPYTEPLRKPMMPSFVFADFLGTQEFLKKSPRSGWVHPVSGRYFYLLTPMMSGRKLTQEAFQSYLQQRNVALLNGAGSLSKETQIGLWNALGVSWVLIDKSDPDNPAEYQKFLRSCWPVAFENTHFAILSPPTPSGAPYLAEAFAPLDFAKLENLPRALDYARHGIVSLTSVKTQSLLPNARFVPLNQTTSETRDYQDWTVPPTGKAGWVVIPQAWHPDWILETAEGKQVPAQVYGSLLGAWTDGNTPITFRFVPPAWYPVAILLSGLFWLLAFALFLRPSPQKTESALPVSSVLPPFPTTARALVLIPTYREAETIEETLNLTLAADSRLNILVIDDQSPDGTADLVKAHPEFNHRIHLLSRSGKLGLGSAYREGFRWGIERDYDALIEMDADLSHNPTDIPRLLAALETGAAVAIGSRYIGGIRVDNWAAYRLMLSKWASIYTRVLTGMPLDDATSGFKAIRKECFTDFHWPALQAGGYGFQIELHYQFWRMGLPIQEVPITFTDRKAGETKMNLAIAVEAARRVAQLSLQGK